MKKLLNKKGFTLMEMLIVVAIIVILVAISIPAFSGSLEKANKATDAANLRSAQAAFVVQNMDGEFETTKAYYYDFKQGKFVEVADDAAAESAAKTGGFLGSCSNHTGAYIKADVANRKAVWSDSSHAESCD